MSHGNKMESEMKKILGIVGSPRKNGNTHILVSTILQSAGDIGAETDLVLLGDKKIKECTGCHACWKGRPCPRHDDMNDLYPKIIECSALVLGTPVYWYGPTALMKAVIDRFVYFNCESHRPMVRGKRAAVAVVLEETREETWRPVVEFFRKSLAYLEMELAETIVVPGVGAKGAIRQHPDQLEEAYRLGARLARG